MRKEKLITGTLALLMLIAFGLYIAGGCLLLNNSVKGWICEGIALAITVPILIFTNRKEKDR